MGVTERGIIKNMKVIKLPFACSQFFMLAQNQRQTGSFVRTKFVICTTCHFPLHVFYNLRFRDDSTGLTHVRIGCDFQYI